MGCVLRADREEEGMDTVTISPRFQVVIPNAIRRALGLQPGQKLKVLLYDNRIEMIPVRPVAQLRGFLKRIDTAGGDR